MSLDPSRSELARVLAASSVQAPDPELPVEGADDGGSPWKGQRDSLRVESAAYRARLLVAATPAATATADGGETEDSAAESAGAHTVKAWLQERRLTSFLVHLTSTYGCATTIGSSLSHRLHHSCTCGLWVLRMGVQVLTEPEIHGRAVCPGPFGQPAFRCTGRCVTAGTVASSAC